ncbi:MAG: DUF4157 domain-containing protein [Bacteroidales bacterium]|nr:DUF4157 domain-containing protein [Bacteroidales bacterium]
MASIKQFNDPLTRRKKSQPVPTVQRKMKVGSPNDKSEQEANNVADRVMRMPENEDKESLNMQPQEEEEKVSKISRQAEAEEEEKNAVSMKPEEEEASLQKQEDEELQKQADDEEKVDLQSEEEETSISKASEEKEEVNLKSARAQNMANYAPSTVVNQINTSQSGGQALPKKANAEFSQKMGRDFSDVKIHKDSRAVQMNKDLSAKAFTHKNHIYFNQGKYDPDSLGGKRLLAHELTHTIQQNRNKNNLVQKFDVDDVTVEMNGKTFVLVEDWNGILKGTKIIIVDWKGTKPKASAYYIKKKKKIAIEVPKYALKPEYTSVAGVSKYEVGLDSQRSSVKKSQKKLDDWKSKEGQYKKNRELWEKELKRLEGLHAKREKTMSRMLVRETMYNRFDADIKKWVDFYNTKYSPKTNLKYNIVKSIIFQETRMGTSGVHLKSPPYNYHGTPHPIKSRFNLGQVIDSFGPQQYLMIKEMAPKIYTKYGFDKFEKEAKWKGMTGKEWWTENFRKAIEEFSKLKDASGENLMGNKKELFLDYEFWIRATVKWLFQKFFIMKSWSKAVKAYNGSGKAAENYKKAVIDRSNKTSPVSVDNN